MKEWETIAPAIDQIQEIIEKIPGWTPVDQLHTLFSLVLATSDLKGDVLEIGSWCGRSSVVLGHAARIAGDTTVTCIDLFPSKEDWTRNPDGSWSFRVRIGDREYGGYEDQTVWEEPFEKDIAPIYQKYDSVYDVFMENMERNGLQEIIQPHRGDSGLLQEMEDFRCRLAFLDGDHSYDAVCRDIENVERCLISGGWITFDDAFSYYDGVDRAIRERIIESGKYESCQQMTRKLFIARRK